MDTWTRCVTAKKTVQQHQTTTGVTSNTKTNRWTKFANFIIIQKRLRAVACSITLLLARISARARPKKLKSVWWTIGSVQCHLHIKCTSRCLTSASCTSPNHSNKNAQASRRLNQSNQWEIHTPSSNIKPLKPDKLSPSCIISRLISTRQFNRVITLYTALQQRNEASTNIRQAHSLSTGSESATRWKSCLNK